MQLYIVYLHLGTDLRVSGGTSTHHQERIQLYLQHLVLIMPLLLPAAIAEAPFGYFSPSIFYEVPFFYLHSLKSNRADSGMLFT
jgi:hypothetical protein